MNDVSIGFGWESAKRLSDHALLAEVGRVSRAHRVLTAELVAHLAEMDERKLYLREALPSMFVYCVKRLGFSEDEACRRIDAARLVRKWPMILRKIGSGELSLTVVGRLKSVLTNENASELVEAVSGMSVRDAERILATRFPKPDVPDSIRKLPERTRSASSNASSASRSESRTSGAEPGRAHAGETNPDLREPGVRVESASDVDAKPGAGVHAGSDMGSTVESVARAGSVGRIRAATGTDSVADTVRATGTDSVSDANASRPVDRGRFVPLSAERIQVKFTASRELEEKIAFARELMSHKNPRGDLATIFEAALDLWIANALKKKLGVTERAQQKRRPAKREHVANETRREVLDRDGLGCAFVNESGERCRERAFLELDHRAGKARGSEPANVRLLCRAHNQAEAERVYGKAHMERSRRRKQRDEVRERRSTSEFVVGLQRPRRRGCSSSAGRTTAHASFLDADYAKRNSRRVVRSALERSGARTPSSSKKYATGRPAMQTHQGPLMPSRENQLAM